MLHLNKNIKVSPEKRLYVDMDGVLVDFNSGVNRLSTRMYELYKGHPDKAPGVFALMDPVPGAIDAVWPTTSMSTSSPPPLGTILPPGVIN